HALWAGVRGGSGAAVVLTGEPGIGKTRLAGELLAGAAADGALVAAGAALELGGAPPFGLWTELLRDLTPHLDAPPPDAAWPSDLARLAPEIERRFGRPPSAAGAPELERARLFEGMVGLLEWAARTRPLALLLEDAHIADGPSLELAAYAARRIAGLPVLLVITRRSRPQRPELDAVLSALRARRVVAWELELQPLPEDAVGELARAVAPLGEGDVVRVVEAAEGNALLAVETARAVSAGASTPPPSLRGCSSISARSRHGACAPTPPTRRSHGRASSSTAPIPRSWPRPGSCGRAPSAARSALRTSRCSRAVTRWRCSTAPARWPREC